MAVVTESSDKLVLQFLDRFCSNIVTNLMDSGSHMSKKLDKRKNKKDNYYDVSMPDFYSSFTVNDKLYVMQRLSPDLYELGYKCAFVKKLIGYVLRVQWL